MNWREQSKWLAVGVAALSLLEAVSCSNSAAMNESTANVKHVTQADFADEVTRASGPVVVDFYATWCGPCRVLGPMLDQAAEPLAGKIKFFKVNIDESPGLAQNFQIEGVPTVLLFKDGKLTERIVGLPTEAALKTKLDALAAMK
jgi:thioredoxin 1